MDANTAEGTETIVSTAARLTVRQCQPCVTNAMSPMTEGRFLAMGFWANSPEISESPCLRLAMQLSQNTPLGVSLVDFRKVPHKRQLP